jgi:hypothetical protein
MSARKAFHERQAMGGAAASPCNNTLQQPPTAQSAQLRARGVGHTMGHGEGWRVQGEAARVSLRARRPSLVVRAC